MEGGASSPDTERSFGGVDGSTSKRSGRVGMSMILEEEEEGEAAGREGGESG